jgi:succinate dehydrogenase/fumarate reductase cytochrome b subunit
VTLSRIQAASGLLFSIFLGLHLATTTSALGGIEAYDRVLTAVRTVYRPHLVVELLLVGVPLVVHVASAIAAMARRKRGAPTSWRTRIHRWTGWFLLANIGGHVFVGRVVPALVDPVRGADFAYFSYSVMNWPWLIIPYYFVFVSAGTVHLCLGVALALKLLWPAEIRARVAMRAGGVAAALVTAVALAGVIAIFVRAPTASRALYPMYRAGYARYMPFMKPAERLLGE